MTDSASPAVPRSTARPPGAGPRALRRRLEAAGISLLAALVLYVGTRWPAAGPLVGVGFALFLAPAVVERWRSPIFGFVPGWLVWLWASHWQLSTYHWIAAILLPPILSAGYVLAPVLAAGLRRATGAPAWVILPIAMGTTEWLNPMVNPGNFNLYGVGTFLFDWPVLAQAADVIGAPGLTVLWMIPCGLLIDVARWWIDGTGPCGRRFVVSGGIASAAVVAALVGYGLVRPAQVTSQPGPRVAIIQPSLDHGYDINRRVVSQQQQMTARWVKPGAADLIVWPENAILANYERTPEYQSVVRWLADSRDAPMLFGAQGTDPTGTRPSNTAYLVDQAGEITAEYHKVILFPFTERRVFPALEEVWPWLHRQVIRLTLLAWRDAPNGWAPEKPEVLPAEIAGETWRVWTPICYETSYPDLGRDARMQGAEFYVNLTSTGWLGWPPANAMLAASVMRAVEGRVGLVRAANTGVSGFVSPTGEISEILRGEETGAAKLEAGVLIRRVHISDVPPPFYSRWGGYLDPVSFILVLAAFGWGFVRRRQAAARPTAAREEHGGS
jgi:apolipoprotein N-acyltransferase